MGHQSTNAILDKSNFYEVGEGATIQLEATGAMRSGDLNKERWDLISGSAIRQLSRMTRVNLDRINAFQLVEMAIQAVWDFLSHTDNLNSASPQWPTDGYARDNILIRGWWCLSVAIHKIDYDDAKTNGTSSKFELDGALPYYALRRCARACAEGVVKYGEENWHNGFRTKEVANHALSHMIKWTNGFRDEDDLGHAMWNFMVAVHNLREREELNDLLLGHNFSLTDEIRTYHDQKKAERGILQMKEAQEAATEEVRKRKASQ